MTMDGQRRPRASLPLVARLADRATAWLQAWRSWLGVVGLFAVLLIPVLTLIRAHWTSPQPPLVLVLGLAIAFVWVMAALRLRSVFIHLISLAAGAGVTWWFGYGLGVGAGLHVFAAFLVALVWLTGYLSAWSVLRLRNAWLGVIAGALVLIINLNNLPGTSSLWFVLFFVAAALFIFEVRLTRNTTAALVGNADPRRGWYLLGTLLLSLLLVATSLALLLPQPRSPAFQTMVATRITWKLNLDNSPLNIFDEVPSRQQAETVTSQGDLMFGSVWHSGDEIDFIVRSPVPSYWRVRVYDTYTDQGWTNAPMTAYLLDKNTTWVGEPPPDAASQLITYQVTTGINTDLMLTAGTLVTADTPYLVHVSGNDLLAATTPRVLAPNEQYTVTSAYRTPSGPQLAAAPAGYPASLAPYLSLPDSLPQNIRDLAAQVTANATTPYEKVAAIDRYLATFKYDTGIDAPPPGVDGVEYFLFTEKAGFCTYFASSMAVMLRSVGVPARLVVGYLPGEAGPEPGEYILRDKYYHAWPQAWFQGYGWVDLEATPSTAEGSGGSRVTLPEPFVESPNINTAEPGNVVPFDFRTFLPAGGSQADQGQPDVPRNVTHGKLPFADQLGVAMLVLILAGATLLVLMIPATTMRAAFSRWLWHVDRKLVAVETYQKMGRLAALAKLGPDASQTPSEYAAALAEALPEHAEDLATIADAYVGARFGRAASPNLFEEAEILKARCHVYTALLERVGFMRRFFRRR